MTKYYVIEAKFTTTKWEHIGERYVHLHKAVEEMERIDLTFPTRICKITKEIVLAEKIDGKRKKNPERSRVVKTKKK